MANKCRIFTTFVFNFSPAGCNHGCSHQWRRSLVVRPPPNPVYLPPSPLPLAGIQALRRRWGGGLRLAGQRLQLPPQAGGDGGLPRPRRWRHCASQRPLETPPSFGVWWKGSNFQLSLLKIFTLVLVMKLQTLCILLDFDGVCCFLLCLVSGFCLLTLHWLIVQLLLI